MQVILLSDVKNVGKKYEIVDVAPGYARNFLIPRDLGEAVMKTNARRVAELQKRREVETKRQHEALEKAFAGVKGASITITRPANEEGHLYAGVTAEDLALALGGVINADIKSEHIELEKAIKEVGEFAITAKVGEKSATFTVIVAAEEA